MKQLLVLLFLLPLCTNAQGDLVHSNNEWLTNYDLAIKQAKKEKKNILLYFTGSDWCPPCKMLKKDLFETPEFKTLSKEYVLLYIDVPRNKDLLSAKQMQHNKGLLAKLNKKGVFPLLKILNTKGKELDKISGYSMNGEIQYHINLLKRYK